MALRGFSVRRLFMGALLMVVVLWLGSVAAVVYAGRQGELQHADAVVVLGAAQYAGSPSPVLRSRLDHAIQLFKSGYAPLLIVTGGAGRGDTTTEADVGRKYAMAKGVPDAAIVVENRGRTTVESLGTVAAMLKAREMTSAIFVSDAFHMLRLRILARKLDIRAYTAPAPNSPIRVNGARGWRYILSESIKAPLAFILEKP
jgi:uncharacterized SAM-binding protein YcdF (DUF218 family)